MFRRTNETKLNSTVYQSWTPKKCFFSRWRPRWPPIPLNDRNSVNINSSWMILVSIRRFLGARNTLIPLKMTLNHYLTSKSNMTSKIATGTSIFPTFHHSNVVIFLSILRFMDARTTLRQLWISLSCWVMMLNSWPSAVHYHLMHLCPQSTFQSVIFLLSSVVWIVTVFSITNYEDA